VNEEPGTRNERRIDIGESAMSGLTSNNQMRAVERDAANEASAAWVNEAIDKTGKR